MSESSIGYKDLTVVRGMFRVKWHPQLINVFLWCLVRFSRLVLTAAWELGHPSGMHETIPLRAIDLRSWIFKDPQAVCDDINLHWIYDSKRPEKEVCIFHDTGSGPHLHLQVHNNTVYRKEII